MPPEGKEVNMKPLEEGRAFPPRDAVLPQTERGLTGAIAQRSIIDLLRNGKQIKNIRAFYAFWCPYMAL